METDQKNLLRINISQKPGLIFARAFDGMPITLLGILIFAGVALNFELVNKKMFPLLNLFFNSTYFIFILIYASVRGALIYQAHKRLYYELLPERLVAKDCLLNEKQFTVALINASEVKLSRTLIQTQFGVGDIAIILEESDQIIALNDVEDAANVAKLISTQIAYTKKMKNTHLTTTPGSI